MASFGNIKIEWETRLCKVDDRIGYFHTWEQYNDVIPPSPLKGGHPGGTVSEVFAIVEFEDGVERVCPHKIKFIDQINADLGVMNKLSKEVKEKEK